MKINIAWSSHLAVLNRVIQVAESPVLELGIGFFSTPYLHWVCQDKGFKLESFEKIEKYYTYFRHAQTPNHKITLVDDWDKADIERHWGMAFIDNDEERRRPDTIRLANWADYVILHDTTGGTKRGKESYHLEEIFSHYKYRVDFDQFNPATSVLSNFKDLSFLK